MSEKVFTITCQCINCGAISKEEYELGLKKAIHNRLLNLSRII